MCDLTPPISNPGPTSHLRFFMQESSASPRGVGMVGWVGAPDCQPEGAGLIELRSIVSSVTARVFEQHSCSSARTPLAIFFENRVGSTRRSSITEGVGFEPTSPFGRQFSRLVH